MITTPDVSGEPGQAPYVFDIASEPPIDVLAHRVRPRVATLIGTTATSRPVTTPSV